jgi:hypothetical protein
MQQNLSKTNPVHTTKAKAFDLANAIPNSLVSSLKPYRLVVLPETKTTYFVSITSHVVAKERVRHNLGNRRLQLTIHSRNTVSARNKSTKWPAAL